MVSLPARLAVKLDLFLVACAAPEHLLLHTAFWAVDILITFALLAALGEHVLGADTPRNSILHPRVFLSCEAEEELLDLRIVFVTLTALPGLNVKLSWLLELTSEPEPAGTDPAVMDFYVERVVSVVERTLFDLFVSCKEQSVKDVTLQILTQTSGRTVRRFLGQPLNEIERKRCFNSLFLRKVN